MNAERQEILRSLGRRSIAGVPLLIASFLVLGGAGGDLLSGFAFGLIGCGLLVAAAIVYAQPLARLCAQPFGSLFFPSAEFDRPQPAYGIPECARANGRPAEAMAELERIAAEDPQQLKAYVLMIDIAVVDFRDAGLADALYRRGLAALAKPPDRQALARVYEAFRSRLDRPARQAQE